MNANDIKNLLTQKHPVEKFVCVPECKIGSSWFKSNCLRLDLWVMARSWATPRFIGYEIKVSRSDFLQDEKWPGYLDYCTEFYFVSPPGIIDPAEVPEQAGLIVTSKNNKRLFTRKKAPVRQVDIPSSIFKYILMSRAKIVSNMFETSPRVAVWENYLKDLRKNKDTGRELSFLIRNRVDKQVKEIKAENRRLAAENEKFLIVEKELKNFDVNIDDLFERYGGVNKKKLSEMLTGLPFRLQDRLEGIGRDVALILASIEERENESG